MSLCKQQLEKQKEQEVPVGNTESESEHESEPQIPGGNGATEMGGDQPQTAENVLEDLQDYDDGDGAGEQEIEIETETALADSLKDLINPDGLESVYLESPDLNLNKIIIPNKDIHDSCDKTWIENVERCEELASIYEATDKEFKSFKKESQKEVNYLVKEFEMKKAADSYARSTTSRTGVLDTSKLHTYKYNEDLFKKVSVIPDGKNHGLVFILDWSGSMGTVLKDTVKQLYSLLWFCKKCNIPFDVYAFTNDYPRENMHQKAYTEKDGLVYIAEWFSLMHFFSSNMSGVNLKKQMINIWRTVHSITCWGKPPSVWSLWYSFE